jgi:arsenate reductase
MMITLYHNPQCSKSCGALELMLKQKYPNLIVRNYIENPLSELELTKILNKLNMKAENLIRKKEKFYQTNFEGKLQSDKEFFQLLLQHPFLMERPILEKENDAIIARPPEILMNYLSDKAN